MKIIRIFHLTCSNVIHNIITTATFLYDTWYMHTTPTQHGEHANFAVILAYAGQKTWEYKRYIPGHRDSNSRTLTL
jgi:hypothetical protein